MEQANVFALIEAQQKGKEGSPAWMVGEQLKDICRREPVSAELIGNDLGAITLEDVAGRIKARADEEHKKNKGSCVCIPPNVAEEIIRGAYGLAAAGVDARDTKPETMTPTAEQKPTQAPAASGGFLDLADFL